jgi:hypothetical protein
MKIKILHETDLNLALFGLGLSHGLTSGIDYSAFLENKELQSRLYTVALTLAPLGKGHNKFLESIQVYLDLQLPRYVWVDLDTYRVGITKQSEATNHTITKRFLIQEDFEEKIPESILDLLNDLILKQDLYGVKNILPESFLQRRIVCLNYKCLQNIVEQRRNHKLPQFKILCEYLQKNLRYPEFLK